MPIRTLLLGLCCLSPTAPVGPNPDAVVRQAWVMGTRLELQVESGSRLDAIAASEGVVHEIERFDRMLSNWDPGSAVSRLNDAPVGERVTVGTEVALLLTEALEWAERTGRAFDPSVGAFVELWGLREPARAGPEREVLPEPASWPLDAFEIDTELGLAVRRAEAASLETGAFGKGAALAAARARLLHGAVDRAFVDLGGQVLALGDPGEPWSIAIAHPSDRTRPVVRLRVQDVAVSTSGNSERWVERDGSRIGHILDPRTGKPTASWGSVTVVAEDPLAADVLSTALYVQGPDEGMRWMGDDPDVGVLFLIDRAGTLEARWNPAMERWFDNNPPVVELTKVDDR
jgi:thiamine biosynthesis lipoprotein